MRGTKPEIGDDRQADAREGEAAARRCAAHLDGRLGVQQQRLLRLAVVDDLAMVPVVRHATLLRS